MTKTRENKTRRRSRTRNIRNTRKRSKTYSKNDFNSGDGMLTSVWGPSLWHYLHTMSFNYPVNPTRKEKIYYRDFILSLKNVLPCKYCRMNLRKNFKALPLHMKHMKNRETFSRYVYELHEHINNMLGKKSGLKYCDVRERYEHFRARCTIDLPDTPELKKIIVKTKRNMKRTRKNRKKEKGCVEPLYGKKSKCVIKIVPQEEKVETFQMDQKCIKKKFD